MLIDPQLLNQLEHYIIGLHFRQHRQHRGLTLAVVQGVAHSRVQSQHLHRLAVVLVALLGDEPHAVLAPVVLVLQELEGAVRQVRIVDDMAVHHCALDELEADVGDEVHRRVVAAEDQVSVLGQVLDEGVAGLQRLVDIKDGLLGAAAQRLEGEFESFELGLLVAAVQEDHQEETEEGPRNANQCVVGDLLGVGQEQTAAIFHGIDELLLLRVVVLGVDVHRGDDDQIVRLDALHAADDVGRESLAEDHEDETLFVQGLDLHGVDVLDFLVEQGLQAARVGLRRADTCAVDRLRASNGLTYFLTDFEQVLQVQSANQVTEVIIQGPDPLLDGEAALSLALTGQVDILPHLDATLLNLSLQPLLAGTPAEQVNGLAGVDIVPEQLGGPVVVPLVLLDSDVALDPLGLVLHVQDQVAEARAAPVIVENKYDPVPIPDDIVQRPLVPLLVLPVHQREPVEQTLRVYPHYGHLVVLGRAVLEHQVVLVGHHVVVDVDLEPVGLGEVLGVLLYLLPRELGVVGHLVAKARVAHYLVGVGGRLAEFGVLVGGQHDPVVDGLDGQVVGGHLDEPLAAGDAVGREGLDPGVGHQVFLDLGLGLVEDVAVLLLAVQVGLVEGVGSDLDGLDALEFDAKFGEFLDLVRVVRQQDEVRVYLQYLVDVPDAGVVTVVVLHAQALISLEGVNVALLLVVLDGHAGAALADVPAAPALLNQVEKYAIARADLLDRAVELLHAVAVQGPHQLGGHAAAVEPGVELWGVEVAVSQADYVALVDEVLEGVGRHLTVQGRQLRAADVDGCADYLVEFGSGRLRHDRVQLLQRKLG